MFDAAFPCKAMTLEDVSGDGDSGGNLMVQGQHLKPQILKLTHLFQAGKREPEKISE